MRIYTYSSMLWLGKRIQTILSTRSLTRCIQPPPLSLARLTVSLAWPQCFWEASTASKVRSAILRCSKPSHAEATVQHSTAQWAQCTLHYGQTNTDATEAPRPRLLRAPMAAPHTPAHGNPQPITCILPQARSLAFVTNHSRQALATQIYLDYNYCIHVQNNKEITQYESNINIPITRTPTWWNISPPLPPPPLHAADKGEGEGMVGNGFTNPTQSASISLSLSG